MNDLDTVQAFAALGQPKRLEAFKMLLARGPQGMHAGDLARNLKAPFNTVSAHMAILARAGLVQTSRQGRFVTYRADVAAFAKIVTSMFKDCCDGRPELCAPMFDEFRKLFAKP